MHFLCRCSGTHSLFRELGINIYLSHVSLSKDIPFKSSILRDRVYDRFSDEEEEEREREIGAY
jgi:hypothetical protein